MAQYRRSIFLINKKFQFKFALYSCSWLLALSFIYPLIIYSLFDYFVRYASMDPNGPSVQSLMDTKQQVIYLLIALQAIFLGIMFLISIFVSHRIAGPLYKLSKFFEEAKAGNLNQELYFRDKDHFKELAQEYNAMIKSVRGRMDTAATHIERALQDASPQSRQELEKAISTLRGLQR